MFNIPFDINIIWIVWFSIAVIFFLIEMFTPTFITIFFSAGALLAGGAALLEFSLSAQVATFTISSVVLLILLRKRLPNIFSEAHTENEVQKDHAINAHATVVEAISCNSPGRIKYQGSFWNAEADDDIAPESVVRIVSRKESDPNTFIVTKD
ncbi:NfeD family protein [Halodesulfovibrio spirochaetisodalis]|uniref:Uncharacterized protein n=1 Tax=Halodesulfovibrio spirochaetisodalis TaxID=1560234 RepID=A0A1B7XMZ8_9BACT|nr:NfeD family protein [Halodesulfovibrio spirochaetisodalis]OBQ56892.1 hypothetical protein SP90_02225 [Halodesulfovibrio spirochaetisodalis]